MLHGVMVQIREFPINARLWSVADQTSEQAQSGVPLRGFRDPEQRKGIPRSHQTFVRDHQWSLPRLGCQVERRRGKLDRPSRQRGNQEQTQTIATANRKGTDGMRPARLPQAASCEFRHSSYSIAREVYRYRNAGCFPARAVANTENISASSSH